MAVYGWEVSLDNVIRYYRDQCGGVVDPALWDGHLRPNNRIEIGAEQCALLEEIRSHPAFRNHFGAFKVKLVPIRSDEGQPLNHPEIEWYFGITFKGLTSSELETLAQFGYSPRFAEIKEQAEKFGITQDDPKIVFASF